MIPRMIEECNAEVTRLEKEIQRLRAEQKQIIKFQRLLKKAVK